MESESMDGAWSENGASAWRRHSHVRLQTHERRHVNTNTRCVSIIVWRRGLNPNMMQTIGAQHE